MWDGLARPLQIGMTKNRPVSGAAVVSFEATYWASRARGITPPQKLILYVLSDFHTADFGCEIELPDLADETEIPVSEVQAHLQELERCGWVRMIREGRICLSFEDDFSALDERGRPT